MEIWTSARWWDQNIEVESPPSLPRCKRSLRNTGGATAPSALRRTWRDIDEVSEIKLLSWSTKASHKATSAGCQHHGRGKRSVMGGRSRRGHYSSSHHGVCWGGRGCEVEQQIRAFFANCWFTASRISFAVTCDTSSVWRRGTRWGRMDNGGADLK